MLLTHAHDCLLLLLLVPQDAINVSLILLNALLLWSLSEVGHVLGFVLRLHHALILLLKFSLLREI